MSAIEFLEDLEKNAVGELTKIYENSVGAVTDFIGAGQEPAEIPIEPEKQITAYPDTPTPVNSVTPTVVENVSHQNFQLEKIALIGLVILGVAVVLRQ